MKPLAIKGTYADWRLVKTRGVVQIVIEIPLTDSDVAYEVMGGMPQPGSERWFAIAAIRDQQQPPAADAKPEPVDQPRPARAKRDWRDMLPSNQAWQRCEQIEFEAFLRETRPHAWREAMANAKECIYLICGITSRSQLDINHDASTTWHQLDEDFLTWKALERAS